MSKMLLPFGAVLFLVGSFVAGAVFAPMITPGVVVGTMIAVAFGMVVVLYLESRYSQRGRR